MNPATAMVAVPAGLAAALTVAGALLWWHSYRRDPGTPQTRGWTIEELRHVPPDSRRLQQEIAARELAERQQRRVAREGKALAEQVQQLDGRLNACRERAEADAATLRHIRRLTAAPLTDAQFRARVAAALAGEAEGGDR